MILIRKKFLNSWCPNGAEFQHPSNIGVAPADNYSQLCRWDQGSYPKLFGSRPVLFIFWRATTNGNNVRLAIDFIGTKYSATSSHCGNTSGYITSYNSFYSSGFGGYYMGLGIDLVKAYDDALWTSSIAMNIYFHAVTASPTGFSMITSWGLASGFSKSTAPPVIAGNCSSNSRGTITVTDDGAISWP